MGLAHFRVIVALGNDELWLACRPPAARPRNRATALGTPAFSAVPMQSVSGVWILSRWRCAESFVHLVGDFT